MNNPVPHLLDYPMVTAIPFVHTDNLDIPDLTLHSVLELSLGRVVRSMTVVIRKDSFDDLTIEFGKQLEMLDKPRMTSLRQCPVTQLAMSHTQRPPFDKRLGR